MFFSGLVLRIKIQKRWTSLTDYVDFCSVLHGLQIAEYSTKLNGFTILSVVHTHYLILGMVFFLLLVLVEKNYSFINDKVRKYLLLYHIGLNLTVVMLVVRGVVQVLSLDVSSVVLFGIAHLILGISMVLVLFSIGNCIKDSF